MSIYACPTCRTTEFIRIEQIEVDDATGRAAQTLDLGVLKCSNCGARVSITQAGAVEAVTRSEKSTMKVRSSVSASERDLRS